GVSDAEESVQTAEDSSFAARHCRADHRPGRASRPGQAPQRNQATAKGTTGNDGLHCEGEEEWGKEKGPGVNGTSGAQFLRRRDEWTAARLPILKPRARTNGLFGPGAIKTFCLHDSRRLFR